MLSKLLRFSKRQLHTIIVSREIIKPSSPTLSHFKTYNLSLLDQISLNSHTPVVAFYPNLDQTSHDKTKTLELKNSLAKTLTQYYPFAGRVAKTDPTYVDCNDEGVTFIEATNDISLSDFLQRSKHEDLDPLFPDDLIWFDPHIRGDTEGVTCPLAVQVTRFACGGVALASTLSHKVGDGRTILNFINHWAAVTTKKDINPQLQLLVKKMLSKLLRFSRRQLHTIVSREIIKPSSPTPSQLKTYNLSLLDQISINAHQPLIAFYPNLDQTSHDNTKTLELKNSLAKTLTQYYPFAGRVAKTDPTYVDCNDEGVTFIEATNDISLSDFLQRSEHEDLDPLFPDGLIWFDPYIRGDTEGVTCPLAVQVTRFACGGVAVASTLFHKVGDGRTTFNFVNHWAEVTAKKDINPHFLHYPTRSTNLPSVHSARSRVGCVTRSFLFPNRKLNELRAKVTAMTVESGQPVMDPTRVEALSWLLHSRAMAAATKKSSGTFKGSDMVFPVDIRGMLVEKLAPTSIGNLFLAIECRVTSESGLEPHITIGEMRKMKAAFRSIPNLEGVMDIFGQMSLETALEALKRRDESYIYSSMCWFPTYDIDFGWGKPVKVTVGGTMKNATGLMAARGGDGIEATMCLEKEEMKILQNDPELLAFC
ncbi:hypothetical protein SSX86_009315 [Deinandra increscens subsp. villosa]|uniref:Acyltransferase n=1 Tax=Deinandra increscens subsp. villosa TaxID=3103831 RepID=A0AAP0DD22_9ASTR